MSVFHATCNLGTIIVWNVTFGCLRKKNHIIALIVAFVVSVARKIFDIVMIVVYVSIDPCTANITANQIYIIPTVQCAKSTCLVVVELPMKCLVGIQYIGIASVNWQSTTYVARFARRLLTPLIEWHRPGPPLQRVLKCNQSHRV